MNAEEIFLEAVEVFGSENSAKNWLGEPARALDHRRPCEVMQTKAGRQDVLTLLVQLEYCVYI